MNNLSLCNTCEHREKIKVVVKGEQQKCYCSVSNADLTYTLTQCSFFNLDREQFQKHLEYLNNCYKKRK